MGHAHAQRGATMRERTKMEEERGERREKGRQDRRIRDDRQVQCVAKQRFSKFMQALTGQQQQRRV